jgi:hypothetical protein
MGARLKATIAALVFSSSCVAGFWSASAADFPEGYSSVYPPARAYRSARQVCVAEHGPDAPPYGYGCLDHWVRIRSTRDVIQDNGYGYTVTSTTVRRRYPPQYYAPHYEVRSTFEGSGSIYGDPSPLGCPSCE